ncbi:MAG TPA: hypothetical protein VNF68_08040 [Candidatus Baltobacteraceae bacterium]|nr:hypothetical protein [Candidatus Baltobacteraceae bacterium]
MLPALLDDERRRLVRVALMMCAASLSILPMTVPSSDRARADARRARALTRELGVPGRLTFPPMAVTRDPFEPDATDREAVVGVVLRAVVTGAQPRALVEIAGVARVVRVGDRIGRATVVSIQATGLALSGGIELPVTTVRP